MTDMNSVGSIPIHDGRIRKERYVSNHNLRLPLLQPMVWIFIVGIVYITYVTNIQLFRTYVVIQRDLYDFDKAISDHGNVGGVESSSTSLTTSDETKKEWSDVKLVIYMTTHLSKLHISFLPCWYDAIQRLEIFRYADLILYTSSAFDPVPPEILQQLPVRNNNKIIIKYYNNTGYQNGAIQAMIDPFLEETNVNGTTTRTSWFDDYDWVIRLNPDVLIRNDTWLIETMMNRSIDAIFHDCYNRILYPDEVDHEPQHESPPPIPKFHTDFTAFRPLAVRRDLVLSIPVAHFHHPLNHNNNNNRSNIISNAEMHLTKSLWNIYQSQRFVYVNGGHNSVPGRCRLEGIHSPILHVHELVQFCPYYYNATKKGIY